MKLISVACISLLLGICQVQGQSRVEQKILSEVNPHWAYVTLTDEQSMQVRRCSTYREKIQLHLELVTGMLIDRTDSLKMDECTRENRLALLDSLTTYFERSVFPLNNKAPFPTPVFVDDVGTHCAVGYLLHASGYDDVVGKIAEENNLAYVRDLQHLYPVLGNWAQQQGFTVQELAWIQPLYEFFCNEGITLGEIIHNTCYDQCTGGFYADHTTIDQPPDTYLLWGNTFKWHNGQWVEVSHPDCLCPGLYGQEFVVYSLQGDSLYSEIVEAEILGPEELFGYWRDNGEAGLCRSYIEPDPMGGVPPYSFEVYDMEGHAYDLGPLCEGEYYLMTKDANGCLTEEMVELYTPFQDCIAFSVIDIQMNDPIPGYLNVTIFLEGDSTSYITLPFYAEVEDAEGNTMAWSVNSFNQFGGTNQTYLFETTIDPIPINAAVSMQLEFNDSFCHLPIPATTSTRELQELSIGLYPNPLQSEATLIFNELLSNARVQIFNVHGQLVRTWTEHESDAITIQRNTLPQGLYTIQVVAGAKTGFERFVIVD